VNTDAVAGLHMQRPKRQIPISGLVILAAGGLVVAGYPIAWLLLSPKSVLKSTDSAFVNGFGAGVAMALGVIFGVTSLAFAWSQFVPRFSSRNRRRVQIGLLVSFSVALVIVMMVRAVR
jgi:hypothetical protein